MNKEECCMKHKRNIIILIVVVVVGIIGYKVVSHNSYISKSGSLTISNKMESINIPGGSKKNTKYKCELQFKIESTESPYVVVKFLGDDNKEYYTENITTKGLSNIDKTFNDIKGDLRIEIDSKNAKSNVSYSVKY